MRVQKTMSSFVMRCHLFEKRARIRNRIKSHSVVKKGMNRSVLNYYYLF